MLHKLCRLVLMSVFAEFFCGLMLAITAGWPWSCVGIVGAIAVNALKKQRALWAHGQARFATASELHSRGMINGDKGLIVGRLGDKSGPSITSAIGPLFNPRVNSKRACEQALSLFASRKKGPLVTLSNSIHCAIFSRTGGGKGQSFIVPYLLERTNESAVVLDFDGENAKLTARHREKRGQRIEMIDPWTRVTKKPATLNPLDLIKKGDSDAIERAQDIAGEIVVKTGEEKDRFFNGGAEMWITAAIAAVVEWGTPELRSLQTVADMLSGKESQKKLVNALNSGPGLLPRLGGQLGNFEEKTLSSVMAVTSEHLRFLNTPAVAESTSSSSFDPMDLRKGRMTVYLIIPVEHMHSQMGLLRVWLGTLIRASIRGGLERA
jgi:type IV secretion system protein VirD4